MSDSIYEHPFRQLPTAQRPLIGATVLVVEDSRFASEAVRLMCLRSGARIRRADCLKSAYRHLAAYRPSVVIIDLGLPDGPGNDLIRDLASRPDPAPPVIATSGDPSLRDIALTEGARDFLTKPIPSLGIFQETILRLLPAEVQPRGLRVLSDEQLLPDRLAFRNDMEVIAALIDCDTDPPDIQYIAQFLETVAYSAEDRPLINAARQLGADMRRSHDAPDLTPIRAMVAARIQTTAIV
ncbi:response regulator [Pseudoruegeria sp. SK021]|uniref:response regulator n=1 Tax=Pseudoruegeria sp. SK021 TaxID=1933035 RepID=UPI000A23FEEB|nr:response regulator [Pseudoruegeria sp. SK021]OSP55707.1 hypothetical protein BV911_06260 [Pseudoruegeria sp. SK021]